MNEIQKCTASIQAWTVRVLAAKAKLDQFRVKSWLRSEPGVLPKWKRRPRSFHRLASGEIIVYGPGRAQSLRDRTRYLRRDYNARDVDYLKQVVMASRVILADEADVILRKTKPNTSRPKRKPMEADPDVPSTEYRQREPRFMSAEDLVRSQFRGRALERELRRLGRQ